MKVNKKTKTTWIVLIVVLLILILIIVYFFVIKENIQDYKTLKELGFFGGSESLKAEDSDVDAVFPESETSSSSGSSGGSGTTTQTSSPETISSPPAIPE